MMPLAHLGHWSWVFYVIPVAIVVVGIVRGTLEERRRKSGAPTKKRIKRSNRGKGR
jgi:hypothetical protein